MKKIILFLFFIVFALFLLPKNVFAANVTPTATPTENPLYQIKNPVLPENLSSMEGGTFLQKFLNVAITLILIIGSLYFFFMVLLGGIGWISSSGDKARLESAQKQLSNAFIGLVILLGSFAIIKLIEFLFGINIIKFTLPTL